MQLQGFCLNIRQLSCDGRDFLSLAAPGGFSGGRTAAGSKAVRVTAGLTRCSAPGHNIAMRRTSVLLPLPPHPTRQSILEERRRLLWLLALHLLLGLILHPRAGQIAPDNQPVW